MVAELFQALRAAEKKKKKLICFLQKRCREPPTAGSQMDTFWLDHYYKRRASVFENENVFTQLALPFHLELKLLSISVQKRFAAHIITKMLTIDFD